MGPYNSTNGTIPYDYKSNDKARLVMYVGGIQIFEICTYIPIFNELIEKVVQEINLQYQQQITVLYPIEWTQ